MRPSRSKQWLVGMQTIRSGALSRRGKPGLLRLRYVVLLLLSWVLAPSFVSAASPCGGANQRACCLLEASFGACQAGTIQVSGCSGDCLCGGFNPFGFRSVDHCEQTTPCGGAEQRACCLGEAGFGACSGGLTEAPGCSGDCRCSQGVLGARSSSHCHQATPCGGEGQRACCLGEEGFGACYSGLTEVPGCSGDCLCDQGILGASSISHCEQATPCGGAGQRACCLFDASFGACQSGMIEVDGCSGNCLCDQGVLGASSSSHCEQATPCGGEGQRACCLFEANFGACQSDLTEVPGCSGDCRCSQGVFGASSISHCQQATPCGGEGQRACCLFETSFGACQDGLTEVPGCSGDCLCSQGILGSQASGTCVASAPCGGKGQRACCLLDANFGACQDGLIEVPGCNGDCFCGGGIAGATSAGTCTVIEAIAEPTTNMTPPDSPRACPLYGYADMHMHLFGHMGHGGAVLAGKPYDAVGGINVALQQDHGTDLDLVGFDGMNQLGPVCPLYLPSCGSTLFHGDHSRLLFGLPGDTVGAGTQDGAQSNLGVPAFNGWPMWTSTTHQQVYYKWLERAWKVAMMN